MNFKKLFKSGSKKSLTDDQIEAVEEFDIAMEKLEKGNKGPEDETEEETSEETAEETEAGEEAEETEVASEEEEAAEEESNETEEPEKTEKSKVKKKKVEKIEKSESLEKIIGESSEAGAAMDVEPFLKSLVKAIDKKLEAIRSETKQRLSSMNDSFEKMTSFQKAQSDVIIAEGKLLKSLTGVDEESLNEPLDRKSLQLSERFSKSESGEEVSTLEAKVKLTEFAKSGALTPLQVGKVENRLNKNLPLPDYFTEMLKKEDK